MRDNFDHYLFNGHLRKQKASGVILSGGLCSRHGGRNKALIDVGGEKIIDRIYQVMKRIFDDLILVTNEPDVYRHLDAKIVTDIYPCRSAMTGLHAGLSAAENTHAFFTACDAPLIKKELVELMLENYCSDFDVLVPETSAGMEPLFAVYSKRCLPFIEHHLEQHNFKIRDVYKYLNVSSVHEETLRCKDDELISFFNINTPELVDVARDMIG